MGYEDLRNVGILELNNTFFSRGIFSGNPITDEEPAAKITYAALHKKYGDICSNCTIKKESNEECPGPIILCGFDAAVHDTVCTLHAYGVENITLSQIGKVMAGDHRREITDSRKRKIMESLHKMRHVMVSIEATTEMVERGIIGKDEQYVLAVKLLPIKWETDPVSDRAKISLSGPPPLDRYAYDAKQIIKFPWKLMDIRQVVGCETIGVTALKWALAKRVASIKNGKNSLRSNRIRLYYYDLNKRCHSGLFRDLGEDMFVAEGREIRDIEAKMDTYADFCDRILSHMCVEGYIDDYKVQHRSGHRIDAFDIVCGATGTK